MIHSLGKFEKRPAAVRDYKASAAKFLLAKQDTILGSPTVVCEPGIIISRITLEENDTVIRFFVSGGVDGATYLITITIMTVGGRTEVGEIELTIIAA